MLDLINNIMRNNISDAGLICKSTSLLNNKANQNILCGGAFPTRNSPGWHLHLISLVGKKPHLKTGRCLFDVPALLYSVGTGFVFRTWVAAVLWLDCRCYNRGAQSTDTKQPLGRHEKTWLGREIVQRVWGIDDDLQKWQILI